MHLPALSDAAELLNEAPERWGEWLVRVGEGAGAPDEYVEDDRARIRSDPSGWVDVDRRSRTSTIKLPKRPAAAEIVQPFLGSTAVVVAHWSGRHSFHAGAFIAHGGAWGVLGSKGAGKSSLLAALGLRGTAVLTDDVLVIGDGLTALAGPRCVDLREQTASSLRVGETMGVVGTRERWRMRLEAVPAEVPLRGWIELEWGEPELHGVPAELRVRTLFASLALRAERRDPVALSGLMDMFALPMVRLRRPRNLERIDETAALLDAHLEHLADSSSVK
jgi:hypothetical protein